MMMMATLLGNAAMMILSMLEHPKYLAQGKAEETRKMHRRHEARGSNVIATKSALEVTVTC